MKFIPTAIPDVLLIEKDEFKDDRGFFIESYHKKKYYDAGIDIPFVQDNHSGSIQGVLRGMHYQIKYPQGKLVEAIVGEIYDVAVDLRRSSPTFGEWVGAYLSQYNRNQLWIPPGFAHGFYVMSDWAEIRYKATDLYAPEWDRTLRWNDTTISINWPLNDNQLPLLSTKDAEGKTFTEADVYD